MSSISQLVDISLIPKKKNRLK